jgi:ubiquinone biosynthesis protein COQ9
MDEATKDKLIMALLPHAAFDGWTDAALVQAAHDLGLDVDRARRAFPCGGADLVAAFVGLADRRMAEDMAQAGPDAAGIGEKVFQAVKLRLDRWADHREAIRRATSVLALPSHLGLGLRLSWGTADAIWRAVGDAPHDFSWYTKRASLAAVYGATLLYWLEDGSDGSAETWAFLRRRLGDVRELGKLRSRVEQWGAKTKGSLAAKFQQPTRRWASPVRRSSP